MKNKKITITSCGVVLLFALFFGCGEHAGEKEYNKAIASWKSGDYSRAQGQMEKAIRKLSDKEKKAVANNQLGLILWNLDKKELAVEKFSESCRLTDELTGADLNLGVALFYANQLEQAEFEFTKILNEQPENTTARAFMGLIHMQKKDWKEASKVVSSGLKNNPSDPIGQNALALAELHISKNSNNAITRLKQTLAAYPDYAPAAYNLAVIYDQWLGNSSAALEWYKKYLQKAGSNAEQANAANKAIMQLGGKKVTPTTNALPKQRTYPETAAKHLADGTKLHAAKNYTEAVVQYEKSIQADPSQKTAYYNLGLSLYELKKYKDATTACTNALNLDSNFSNARYMLSLSYAKQSKWNDAEREANLLKETDEKRGESMLNYISDARK
jgi:tetratricopeptide (TPR) repeat protein